MEKRILEQAQTIPVYDEADVIVVGGGPAGHSAAVAAARNGAKVILLERYGCLGGMASGGIVVMIPHLSNGDTIEIRGLQQEWLDRLAKIPGGILRSEEEEVGSSDPALLEKWKGYWGMITDHQVAYGAFVDPELLKVVLQEMVEEQPLIQPYFHCWGAKAITENGAVNGVIFESKEGRKAVLGKVVIDCTGDGDIFASAGAAYDETRDFSLRNSKTALVYRVGGCDFQAYANYCVDCKAQHDAHMAQISSMIGYKMLPFPTSRNDIAWINTWLPDRYCLEIKGLTDTEMTVRRTMLGAIDYLRAYIPGFQKAYLLDTAPQVGTRISRRLRGVYTVTVEDLKNEYHHDDTIALLPAIFRKLGTSSTEIPYRALVPEKVENLLVAGRCYSTDVDASNWVMMIPHCVATGQAAGTAAALALGTGTSVRQVDTQLLRRTLISQGVYLPD